MCDEIENIILNYDRDMRTRAEELYEQMYNELEVLEQQLSRDDVNTSLIRDEMIELAAVMRDLNYAVCSFEHEKISELAQDCPPRLESGMRVGMVPVADDEDETLKALRKWLRVSFPEIRDLFLD